MNQLKLLITGATGLPGCFLLVHLAQICQQLEVTCLVRPSSDLAPLKNLNIKYLMGDSSTNKTWNKILDQYFPDTIIHIASIRHIPIILKSLKKIEQNPRLIVVGTTGVYSQYNQYSAIYKEIEDQLAQYNGSSCLLRPTMIYGSHRDKNIHKLIKFCDHYGFFPVFGGGKRLLQPIHAEDLAQAILSVLQRPDIQGFYNLSGGSVVTFLELLKLVEKHLGKRVIPLTLPSKLGLLSATILEKILGERSPVRQEQILRLEEDKAYTAEAAVRDFDFSPRSLDTGLQQEVEILRTEGILR